jgi:hypothetical protein
VVHSLPGKRGFAATYFVKLLRLDSLYSGKKGEIAPDLALMND